MNTEGWWSERILFGLLLIGGYFLVVALCFVVPVWVAMALPADKLALVMPAVLAGVQYAKDSLLVIGPLLGVIVNSIWKADKADKANAQAMATLATAAAAAAPAPAATSRFP